MRRSMFPSRSRLSGRKWQLTPMRIVGMATALAVVALMVLLGTGVLKVPFITDAVGAVFTPVQRTMNNWFTDVRSWSREKKTVDELNAQISQMQAQYDILEEEIAQMEQIQQENQRLQQLLNYAEKTPDVDYRLAYVSAMEPSQWFCEFTIDCGADAGIAKGNPVYSSEGLIGRVIEVGENYATVMTLVDSRSAVSCYVQRTRDNGVVRGNAGTFTEGLCRMLYLPDNAEVTIGDEVYTSGLDGIYPKGLLVGKIASISRESGSGYVVVDVSADYMHIEEVLVQVSAP